MLWVLIVALLLFFLFNRTIREGATSDATSSVQYDPDTCLSKASQNASNIQALRDELKAMKDLQTQVTAIQQSCDANTTSLKQLTDQVMATT